MKTKLIQINIAVLAVFLRFLHIFRNFPGIKSTLCTVGIFFKIFDKV